MKKPRRRSHAPLFWEPFAFGALLVICWVLLEYYPEYWSIPIGILILSIWNYAEILRFFHEQNRDSILRYAHSPFRRWLYTHILRRRFSPLPKIADSVTAQEGGHRPVQLIAGQKMLYFHYLTANADKTAILPETIVTDFSDMDHRPKYIRKDQRIRYDSIHRAEFFCTPLEMPYSLTKFHVTGLLRLYLGKKKQTVQELYILDGTAPEQMEELFHGAAELTIHTEYPFDGVSMKTALNGMERAHKLWLVLRTVTILSTAVMLQCGASAVGKAAVLTAIIGEALMLLLFCLKGRTWTMPDVWNRHSEPKPRRTQPEISVTLLAPLFTMTLYYVFRHNLLEMGRYLCLSACAALVMLAIFCCCIRMERWNATMAILCILWGAAAVQSVNYCADYHEPQVIESLVHETEEHRASKGGVTYYVTVDLPDGDRRSFSVPPRTYSSLDVGDTVTVKQYQGLLGIGYAEVECAD